MQMRKPNLV